MEALGHSSLGRGLVAREERAAGVPVRMQQAKLSLEYKMEKMGEIKHGRMTLAG